MNFFTKLTARIQKIDSLLCVGLDPHPSQLTENSANYALSFCLNIVEKTIQHAAAYKPNIAFFETYGAEGIEVLKKIFKAIPDDIPILLDAKRGDISSTAEAYATTVYKTLGADAVTLNPYLGRDSIAPFIDNPNQAAFLLCKTSNPGSTDLQDQQLQNGKLLYEQVAELAQSWNQHQNVGLVVGATHPHALQKIRLLAPDLWILAPGVGAQGGNLDDTLQAGLCADGMGMLIPVSRGVSQAKDISAAAKDYKDRINQSRKSTIIKKYISKKDSLAIALFDAGCVKFGDFNLKSGLKSPVYIDLRILSSIPKLLNQVAQEFSLMLQNIEFDHLAALPYSAMPIGTAISLQNGWSMIYPRKEAKSYGTKAKIEGIFTSGDRVVIIDDLTTTGSSKFEAIEKLQKGGMATIDVAVLIDRESGAKENLANKGFELHTVYTLTEIANILHQNNKIDTSELNAVLEFIRTS